MLVVPSRSGAGQDFEFEFGSHRVDDGLVIRVKESTQYKLARFYPDHPASETWLRWMPHEGENRLIISITGMASIPFDDAPEALRRALQPWVEKLANILRKDRYAA